MLKSNSRWLSLLAALLLLCGSAQAQCAFQVPSGWSPSQTRWDGPCANGSADGLGVLKELAGAQVTRLFYGLLKQGQLERGVIEQTDGYIAGRFKEGQLLPGSERRDILDAFDIAAKAAQQAADRFRQAGNTASAKFYADKAKRLKEQMD